MQKAHFFLWLLGLLLLTSLGCIGDSQIDKEVRPMLLGMVIVGIVLTKIGLIRVGQGIATLGFVLLIFA